MRITSEIFCDKVTNDSGAIYFPQVPRHAFFELLCCKLEKETLVGGIRKAYKFIMSEYGIVPTMVFIPFYDYGEYERHVDVTKANSPRPLSEICYSLGLQMVVMMPRELEKSFDSVLKIDREI